MKQDIKKVEKRAKEIVGAGVDPIIIANDNNILVHGKTVDVLAVLSTIVNKLKANEIPNEFIKNAVDIGLRVGNKENDELDKLLKNINKLEKLLKEMDE